MKKGGSFRAVLTVMISVFMPFFCLTVTGKAASRMPSRVINVVYDDSGSMISNGGEKVDTWCQAKYSMEVFAAMLGSGDTMNVYVMSDYDKGRNAEHPRLVLHGADGAEKNVAQVHNMITAAGNTPFNTVRRAYEDLCRETADQKWLVILTDGEFEGGDFTSEEVEAFFAEKEEEIKIMFLGMGAGAPEIHADEENQIYVEKAETSARILTKITEICTRIFHSDRLDVNVEERRISFDIPMAELVIFAQGADVVINGLVTPEGTAAAGGERAVSVKYSEIASTRHSDPLIDRSLEGSIVTFRGNYDAGEYVLDVTGAETIEVYYKPDVELAAWLINEAGEEIDTAQGLLEGEYVLGFGFVKAGTGERVPESPLLGEIQYRADLFGGSGEPAAYRPGDRILLEEGRYRIEAAADYLKYNSLSAGLEFDVYRNRELFFSADAGPVYEMSRVGLVNAEVPVVLKVSVEGAEITGQQWEDFSLPKIRQTADGEKHLDFSVVKTREPGRYEIYPVFVEEEPGLGDYGEEIDLHVSMSFRYGMETWSGEGEFTVSVEDTRSWFWKNVDKVIKMIIAGLVLLFLLGYVPGFKKYLPQKLKKAPAIKCEVRSGMRRTWEVKGKYTKNRLSVLLPYKAETATIRFVPRGVTGVPKLAVKAIGSNRMEIMNTKSYGGKKHITFDGAPVLQNPAKNLKKTAGLRIKCETSDIDYMCVLNK